MLNCFGRKLFLMTCLLFIGFTNFANAEPSFDCSKATSQTEKAICKNTKLQDLDWDLTSLYNRVLNNISYRRGEQIRKSQDRWLDERDTCQYDSTCITKKYKRRIRYLKRYISGPGQTSEPGSQSGPRPSHICQHRIPIDPLFNGHVFIVKKRWGTYLKNPTTEKKICKFKEWSKVFVHRGGCSKYSCKVTVDGWKRQITGRVRRDHLRRER